MNVKVEIGDVLDATADLLISTANPWLSMSGGVNGATRDRDPTIQSELYAYLEATGNTAISAGSVVRTSAGCLSFSHIVHAVAIDPLYDSSPQIVSETLTSAFTVAESLKAKSVAMPTLATGHGPMTIDSFARVFADTILGKFQIDRVTIAVLNDEDAAAINSVFALAKYG